MAQLDDDAVLLISAPRAGAGGLFVLDGGGVAAIDRIATQGLSVSGGRLARIISSGRVASPCGDVLEYDADGLRRSQRVDGLGNIHDGLYVDDALLLVNTAGNAIEALREDGSVATWWQGPPRFDAWHINCLFAEENSVVATAFGQGTRSSAWREEKGADGVVIRLPEETVLVRGLNKPHDPRRIDGLWVVCQSGGSQLLGFDDNGCLQKECTLGGFTRGVAYDATHLFVGESRMRQDFGGARWSRVNVLDRETWRLVDAFEIPAPEIYAIALAPRSLAAGARLALAAEPGAARNVGPLSRFTAPPPDRAWRITDVISPASRRFTIDARIPRTLPANSHVKVTCRFTNHSDATIDSVGPDPVEISYHWAGTDGLPVQQAIRFEIPCEVAPGASCDAEIIVATPDRSGAFRLRLFLTQGDVAWTNAFAGESRDIHDVEVVDGIPIGVADALAPPAAASGEGTHAVGTMTLLATNSGVFALATDGRLTLIDPQPTVALRADETRLYRSIPGSAPATFDLVVYDRLGALGLRRGAGAASRPLDRTLVGAAAYDLVGAVAGTAGPAPVLRDLPHEPPVASADTDVHDVAVVPAALVHGLGVGFRTNPSRAREEAHLARFRRLGLEPVTAWASAGTLWPAAMAVRVHAIVPRRIGAGGETWLSYTVENIGNGWLVPGKPHPVAISYRWYDAQGAQVGRDATSLRTPLPRTLGPSDTLSSAMRVLAPKRCGRFTLLITFVQELVAWFSDSSAANGFAAVVDVVEAGERMR